MLDPLSADCVLYTTSARRRQTATGERVRALRNACWGPSWAIWSWFIPFVDLVLPKQLANDLWRGSDPRLPANTTIDPAARIPWFHTLWWLLFIASGIFDRFAFQRWRDAQSLGSLSSASLTLLASYALDILALGFAFAVVSLTAKRQRNRAEHLGKLATPETATALAS